MGIQTVHFTLDGRAVEAAPGETIWQVAKRHGLTLPHLCYRDAPGYRHDGNCRACMVEVEGERRLTASCARQPQPGMVVRTDSDRAHNARRAVLELLVADQPEAAPQEGTALARWARALDVPTGRYPGEKKPAADLSHAAIAFQPQACISCGLCERACREVQVNGVIGMAWRGAHSQPVFDLADPMGLSTCVGCGECVQACPTGALIEKRIAATQGVSETQTDSLCPYCGVGCQVTYRVRDDHIVGVDGRDGPANHNRLCVKGRFGGDYIHSPQRLTKPLIRRADIPKERSLDFDPANPMAHFREASWEEAMAVAAEGLSRIRQRHGGAALAGFGSAKGSNEEAYLFQKLVRAGFGTNNVDHCTRLCHASSVAALIETIGSGAVTAPVAECLNSDVIFVIGANPTVNHPVGATFMKNAAERGATLIVADPRGQALDRHATYSLRFRPGSDVALLNALMNVIVTEGLEDRDYIERFTEGFDTYRKHLLPFTPERMASVCGIDAEVLRQVARTIARAQGAMIFWGMGISQHVHGTDNARCLIALALMCGHVGKPGAGLHPLRGQNNVQGASDAGLVPMFYPGYEAVDNAAIHHRYEKAWNASLDGKRGLTVVEIMNEALAGRIKGMYIMGENPAMSDPDLNHARAALACLDHLVVQDLFLTETAAFADVVLPSSALAEKSGTFTNTDRRVQVARPALPPPGEARQDLAIIQDMAQRLGLAWDYGGPAEVYEEMRGLVPALAGISWDRLEREDAVTYPCAAEDVPGDEVIFGDGFPTRSGRGRFVPASLVPPDELPDEQYPMVLMTGRLLEHWHTGAMTRRADALDRIEPTAIAVVSPVDAAAMGIEPGKRIAVSTRRGRIECAARIDPQMQPGTLFVPFCFWEAPANMLTNPALDPFGKIPEFKFCAVRIELANTPEPV